MGKTCEVYVAVASVVTYVYTDVASICLYRMRAV